MVLLYVLNGYFRSGTTILWHLLKLSHRDKVHIYEPFHPKLEYHLSNDINKKDPLHGLQLWNDYIKLEGRTLRTIIECSKTLDGSPVTLYEAKDIINALEDDEHEIFIKMVRGHAILPYIAEYYDANVVHIIRCPVCTWLRHFDTKDLNNIDTILGLNPAYPYANRFYLLNTYKKLKQMVNIPFKPNNYLDMFVFNWVISNYIAVTKIIDFENASIYLYEDCRDWETLSQAIPTKNIPRIYTTIPA